MRRSLLLSAIALLATLQVSAWKKQSIDITINGQQRNMVVFTPNKMQDNMPLFIITHGMRQDPKYQYDCDKMYELIDTAKFVITYLAGINKTWDVSGTSDLNFVSKTIDEMATRFNIDKDRVYWSGFSMGSALIYHGMATMQDKIAAFAPTSGVAFGGKEWQKCTKPVNVIHCHAYGDDVFTYDEWNIRDYVKSLALELDQCKSYKMTRNYKTLGGNTGDREIWSDGKNGTMVELFSYNANWHNPSSGNSKEIWNFCKRFVLNQPMAKITVPAGEMTHLCMAPNGEAQFPDITVKATAKAATGSKVTKVEFYDGKNLIDSLKAAPYEVMLTEPTAGKHNLRVVVTDDHGKTGENTCLVNYATVAIGSYSLIQTFKVENCVPQNWYVGTGTTKRAGGGLSFTSGNRILRFTNSTRGFEYGLLIQNNANKAKNAWAKFGDKSGRSCLTLHPGHYVLKYKVCNWNQPDFSPVTVAIEDTKGQEVVSDTYTPTVNIGNNTANKFTGVTLQTMEFDITETGDYVIAFYADAAKNADFVLGAANLQATKYLTTGIESIDNLTNEKSTSERKGCFDLSGRQLSKENLKPGLYIIDGRRVAVK